MGTLAYLARRFVAGETRGEALSAVAALNHDGLLATVDVLGENVAEAEEAVRASQEYLALFDSIDETGVKSNVSVKLSQMGLDVGSDFCRSIMKKLLDRARRSNNFIRIDMEGSPYTERTLQMFYELYREYANVGVVIQAYLHRSETDVLKLSELKAPVRVCKGAYKEPASIAFQNMDDVRRNYRFLVETLLKAGSKVGIATHDEKLIRWALTWTAENKIPREKYEFQMLYGLRRKRARELASQGYTVRQYVPFGSHWFPYFVRRLRERKENVFFVLKSLVAD